MTDLEPGTDIWRSRCRKSARILKLGGEEVAWRGGRRFEHRLTATRRSETFPNEPSLQTKSKGYALVAWGSCRVRGVTMVWPFRTDPAGPGRSPSRLRPAESIFAMSLRSSTSIRWIDRSGVGWATNVRGAWPRWAKAFMVLVLETPLSPLRPAAWRADVVADARLVAPRPVALSPELGAGVPIAFLTAWYGLIECGRLQAGETALIHAAAGGVGQAAVQIARWLGARVLATASADKQSAVAELGADAVFDSRDLVVHGRRSQRRAGWRRSCAQFACRRGVDPQHGNAQTVWPFC